MSFPDRRYQQFIAAFSFMMAILGSTYGACANLETIPALSLRQEYNSNVFYQSDHVKDDFIGIAEPSISLRKVTERLQASIAASGIGYYYYRNDQYNNIDQRYHAATHYQVTERLAMSAETRYDIDSQVDREISDTGLVFNNDKRHRIFLASGVKYLINEKTSLETSGSYTSNQFDSDQYVDTWDAGGDVTLLVNMAGLLKNAVGRTHFSYEHYDYDYTLVDNYFMTLGFSRSISDTSGILVDIGGRYTHYKDTYSVFTGEYDPVTGIFEQNDVTRKTGQWGWVGQVMMNRQWEFITTQAGLERNVQEASGRTNATVRSSITGGMDWRLSEKWSFGLEGYYYLNEIETAVSGKSSSDEETYSATEKLVYAYSPTFRMQFRYGYSHLKNQVDRTTQRHVVAIQADFSMPLSNR